MATFLIGDLSREAGCNAQTIRWYEAEGLLPPPQRTEGNQRRYGAEHVARLAFIRHAREFGFSLDAVRELLTLADEPKPADPKPEVARKRVPLRVVRMLPETKQVLLHDRNRGTEHLFSFGSGQD